MVDVGNEVWAGTHKGIVRIDPAMNREVGRTRIPTEYDRVSLAVVGDGVWFRGGVTEIVRIDPVTKQPVERIELPLRAVLGRDRLGRRVGVDRQLG